MMSGDWSKHSDRTEGRVWAQSERFYFIFHFHILAVDSCCALIPCPFPQENEELSVTLSQLEAEKAAIEAEIREFEAEIERLQFSLASAGSLAYKVFVLRC